MWCVCVVRQVHTKPPSAPVVPGAPLLDPTAGPGSAYSDVIDDAMTAFAHGAHQRFLRWIGGR